MKSVSILKSTDVNDLLQISTTSLDASIAYYLPFVEQDVKQITNNQWYTEIYADLTTSTGVIENVGFLDYSMDFEDLQVGSLIKSSSDSTMISDYKISDWNEYENEITLATTPLDSGSNVFLSVSTFPKGKKPVVAQMVLYKITKNTTGEALADIIESRSLGPSAIKFSQNNYEIKDGYPAYLVDSLNSVTFAGLK